jgi:hypothetical protein
VPTTVSYGPAVGSIRAHGEKATDIRRDPIEKQDRDLVPNGAVTAPTGDPVEHILQLVRALTETAAEVRG